MKVTDKSDIDLILFDDFEHALRAHKAVGPDLGAEQMLVGIRLRTGGMVVIPLAEGSDEPAWEANAHLVPPGGAIVAAPRAVADLAEQSLPRYASYVRKSLPELVDCA